MAITKASKIAVYNKSDLKILLESKKISKNSPEIISKAKLSFEILLLQYLHLPLRYIKLKIGNKSQGYSLCPHVSQWLGGITILSSLILLLITKLANDPNIVPRKNIKMLATLFC